MSDSNPPSPRIGLSVAIAMCALGWTVWQILHSATVPLVIVCGGLLFGLLYCLVPRWRPKLHAGVRAATFPVRFAATFLVLAVVYYAVLTPIAWWFRLSGKSFRRSDRACSTNWQRCSTEDEPQSYFRTF